MRIADIIEAKAPEKLCKSRVPDDQLGASQLASCKSQGLRARDSDDSYTIGGKKVKLRGKKIRGKKYGGPIPAHGIKNKANARKGISKEPISQTIPVVPLTTFRNSGDSP